MNGTPLRTTLVGIVAWALVAVLALVAVDQFDPFWGFFPVAAAVLAAWAVGEWVTGRQAGNAAQ